MSETDVRSNPESSNDTTRTTTLLSLQLNTLKPIKTYNENSLNPSFSREEEEDDDDQCRTPTSVEHRIPEALICPPAPRKPKLVARKRRRPGEGSEFLHVMIPPEEIESFFRRYEKAAGNFMSSGTLPVVVKKSKRVSA